jgi:hypothetical protein
MNLARGCLIAGLLALAVGGCAFNPFASPTPVIVCNTGVNAPGSPTLPPPGPPCGP